jgi:hypothetical protein
MKVLRFKQLRDVTWLNTPAGTIWVTYGNDDNWIQPEDINLRETLLGVDLDLLADYPDEDLFEPIKEEINEKTDA